MLCVCVNVTLLLGYPTNNLSQEQVAAPIYKDGDFWVFKVTRTSANVGSTSTAFLDGDYEVSYASGGLKAFELTGSEKVEITHNISYLQGMIGRDVQDLEYQFLRFPLIVGQKWSREWRQRSPRTNRVESRQAEHRVVGVEQIATRAGSYRAFKVESELVTPVGGRGSYIYYYSPETKSVVKFAVTDTGPQGNFSGKREVELIRFGTVP